MMLAMLAISCLVVLPVVLANDPQCRRCCNLESTVIESTLALVQCDKNGVDCPEEKNIVADYLPEYMRCLTKRRRRAAVTEDDPSCENYCVASHCSVTCERDGRGLQWIMSLLSEGVARPLWMALASAKTLFHKPTISSKVFIQGSDELGFIALGDWGCRRQNYIE